MFMWLELIDKKNNHKMNIFVVFSFFLKKKKIPYTWSLT